jgi:hypothetical protein
MDYPMDYLMDYPVDYLMDYPMDYLMDYRNNYRMDYCEKISLRFYLKNYQFDYIFIHNIPKHANIAWLYYYIHNLLEYNFGSFYLTYNNKAIYDDIIISNLDGITDGSVFTITHRHLKVPFKVWPKINPDTHPGYPEANYPCKLITLPDDYFSVNLPTEENMYNLEQMCKCNKNVNKAKRTNLANFMFREAGSLTIRLFDNICKCRYQSIKTLLLCFNRFLDTVNICLPSELVQLIVLHYLRIWE